MSDTVEVYSEWDRPSEFVMGSGLRRWLRTLEITQDRDEAVGRPVTL